MEKQLDQPTPTVSKKWLVEQIRICLRSGDHARALELLRGAAAEFPNDNDPELSELEKLAHDGVKRNAEANRLITESQDLFAQRKSAEAIQLLRQAHDLDKKNSLARSILANALVEHAHSLVESDWLEAEKLTNQALALNPAHPTAKTIHSLIVDRKTTSSVDDWVARASKLQSSGDLFAALAWVAEGLAVHPDDPKLLQIHEAIQRDQAAQRRQARRGDLEDLRRMQREIDKATDVAAKQALAVRIQTVAAKHWTDGEILSIANALLLRLGVVSQESSSSAPRGKGAPVILHVPRASASKPSPDAPSIAPTQAAPIPVPENPAPASATPPSPAPSQNVSTAPVPPSIVPPSSILTSRAPTNKVPTSEVRQRKVPPPNIAPLNLVSPSKVLTTPPKPQIPPAQVSTPAEPSAASAKVTSSSSKPKQPPKSNSTTLILVSAVVIVLVAATFFFTRKHYASPAATTSSAAPAASVPTASAAEVSAPAVSAPTTPAPTAPAQATSEPSLPAQLASSDTVPAKVAVQPVSAPPPAAAVPNLGTLVVVAGQDNAKVFLNGKLQPQLTQSGQLRLPNLELKDYVVQVSKAGFQDPPAQKIRIHKDQQPRLLFKLQPQPSLSSLIIQGGAPGTAVLVDQTPAGTIQSDGTLSISTVNPGDHTVELRRQGFKPKQLKKQFVAGAATSLIAADAALEALPIELKIIFTPPDASVVVVKGDLLKMVSSGVPLNLPAGTYTLTARTAERFTRSTTLEVVAGQSKTVNLSLAPNGMSKWEDPSAWKHEGDSFVRRGGDFVLYGAVPTAGTFSFSAMPAKGRMLQWVLNYADPKNYILFQMDDNNFYRTVIRNGQKSDQIIVPDKNDKKSFRALQIRVSPTEIVHQIKQGDRWIVLDHWTQPGANLSQGKFGFYIPGSDEVALSSFAHYVELNLR